MPKIAKNSKVIHTNIQPTFSILKLNDKAEAVSPFDNMLGTFDIKQQININSPVNNAMTHSVSTTITPVSILRFVLEIGA